MKNIKKFLAIYLFLTIYEKNVFSEKDIEIIQLEVERWQEFKNLRLKAVSELPHVFGVSFEDEFAKDDYYWKKILIEGKKEKNSWIIFAQINNKLIGMVRAYHEWPETFCKHIVSIANVYVAPEFRGKKVATKLLQEIIQKLEKNSSINQATLWVNHELTEAIKLYLKFGFKIYGTLPHGIKINNNYHDNYLMVRKIN